MQSKIPYFRKWTKNAAKKRGAPSLADMKNKKKHRSYQRGQLWVKFDAHLSKYGSFKGIAETG